jgi:hypothetical protein
MVIAYNVLIVMLILQIIAMHVISKVRLLYKIEIMCFLYLFHNYSKGKCSYMNIILDVFHCRGYI